ncbi:MAG: YncE family protein, partial [Candidatus Binatia bacterium]
SCHVFGDFDSLAWDLGDPDFDVLPNPIPINLEQGAGLVFSPINGTGNVREFNPMKGPMTTQTLRGMVNHGSMHWRGDRTGGNDDSDGDGIPDGDPFDSDAAFRKFNVAFDGLLGGEVPLEDSDEMLKFSAFILEVTLPPNPVRALDDSLTPDEQAGRNFFFGESLQSALGLGPRRSDGLPFDFGQEEPLGFTCDGCHTLAPENGHFGTAGRASFEAETQIVKIPHLRNLYQKVGMFGLAPTLGINPGDHRHMGPQVRGTGFLHDGSIDTLFRFFSATVFANTGLVGFESDLQRRQMERFMLASDTDLPPIVGQQVTLTAASGPDVNGRIDLLLQRANAAFTSKVLGGEAIECDLVVKGIAEGAPHGWVHTDGDQFVRDDSEPIADAALRLLALMPGHELTYTCLPPGSGSRWVTPRP